MSRTPPEWCERMKILDQVCKPEEYEQVFPSRICFLPGGTDAASAEQILLHEHVLDVFLNESHTLRVVCTPNMLSELVLGRLLTEGYIHSAENVEALYVCDQGRRAQVLLKKMAELPDLKGKQAVVQEVSTCCTDTCVLSEAQRRYRTMAPLPAVEWEGNWIWRLLDRFEKDTRLHQLTHATHSAMLSRGDELLFEAEDIGRHNAVDKVIGAAVKQGVDLHACILFTTGRMPVDMVRKAVMARIPVMVSKEAPTCEGAELAKTYGLHLIGNVKNGKMIVYS